MSLHSYPVAIAAVLSASLICGGCIDPENAFTSFQRRYEERDGQGGGGGGGGTSDCTVPDAGELDGDYLFVFTPSATPKTPVLFASVLTTTTGGQGLELSFSFQAVDATDRTTPVGVITNAGPYPVEADGHVVMPLPEFTLDPVGNPYNSLAMTVQSTLEGFLCRENPLCGSFGGAVIDPLTLPLDDSNFTFVAADNGVYPEPPPTNCVGDLADPLMGN